METCKKPIKFSDKYTILRNPNVWDWVLNCQHKIKSNYHTTLSGNTLLHYYLHNPAGAQLNERY